MITIKSTQSPNSIDGSPFDDFGFNYLWRLRGLEKYVPAARPNLKNISPVILPLLTSPLIPSVPKYFFIIYLKNENKL